jgi:uncharacterized RmlC-like cupin family protein
MLVAGDALGGPSPAKAGGIMNASIDTSATTCKVVDGAAPYRSEQGTVYAPGISAETVASRSLFLGLVTLPPGERTRAHVHERHESAFYMLSGDEVELWSGEGLAHRAVAHPGDYLFVPANVPHVAVNRSAKPAVFVGVRNEPTAQESVAMRPELDARVP